MEASDVKNNMLVCVATVADTYGNKLLVHFDGWEDTYDYWCSYSSPHIHHVGWCQENLQVCYSPLYRLTGPLSCSSSWLDVICSRIAALTQLSLFVIVACCVMITSKYLSKIYFKRSCYNTEGLLVQ